eukprot:5592973-Pyramimonas_sp.AAC.1
MVLHLQHFETSCDSVWSALTLATRFRRPTLARSTFATSAEQQLPIPSPFQAKEGEATSLQLSRFWAGAGLTCQRAPLRPQRPRSTARSKVDRGRSVW